MPEIIINGPAGRLEGRYTHSKFKNAPLAIVLHPERGTMNNVVVYHMHHAFVKRGFSVLRFNSRGTGRSQGEFDGGEGELNDAATALDWMQEINPNAPYVWAGGFAFGSWVSMQLLMRRPEIQGFISVAPPANTLDFTFLAPCPTSGLIVQGGRDTIVNEPDVAELCERLHAQKGIAIDYRVIPEAGHFFRNHIDTVIGHMHDHMNGASQGGRAFIPSPTELIEKAA